MVTDIDSSALAIIASRAERVRAQDADRRARDASRRPLGGPRSPSKNPDCGSLGRITLAAKGSGDAVLGLPADGELQALDTRFQNPKWRCVLTTIAIHAVVIVLIVQSFQSGWRP